MVYQNHCYYDFRDITGWFSNIFSTLISFTEKLGILSIFFHSSVISNLV